MVMATTEEALQAMQLQQQQVPEVLRVLAHHRGVKTYEMAAAIGVSAPSMSARLWGKTVILQHEMVGLAKVLDCPEDVLRLAPDLALKWSREHPAARSRWIVDHAA